MSAFGSWRGTFLCNYCDINVGHTVECTKCAVMVCLHLVNADGFDTLCFTCLEKPGDCWPDYVYTVSPRS